MNLPARRFLIFAMLCIIIVLFTFMGQSRLAVQSKPEDQQLQDEAFGEKLPESIEPIPGLVRSPTTDQAPSLSLVKTIRYPVLCRERSNDPNVTIPLGDAEVTIVAEIPGADPFSSVARTNIRGVSNSEIPVGVPFKLIGRYDGLTTHRDLPELSENRIREIFPNGIELPFWRPPATVRIALSGTLEQSGMVVFCLIGVKTLPPEVFPRSSERMPSFSIREAGRKEIKELPIRSGEEVYWAVYNVFGMVLLRGRSGRALLAGEVYDVDISLENIVISAPRYFHVVSGLSIFLSDTSSFFSNKVFFAVYDEHRNMISHQVSGAVDPEGEFTLDLPVNKPLILLFTHNEGQTKEIWLDSDQGLDSGAPVQVSFEKAPRVFLAKAENPGLEANEHFLLALNNGMIRSGRVASPVDFQDDFELKTGWSPIVRSFRLGNRLFSVHLRDDDVYRIPCDEIREIPLPPIRPCYVKIQSLEPMTGTVVLATIVNGVLWSSNRLYNPSGLSWGISLDLPDSPGIIRLHGDFDEIREVPYFISDQGVVEVLWKN